MRSEETPDENRISNAVLRRSRKESRILDAGVYDGWERSSAP